MISRYTLSEESKKLTSISFQVASSSSIREASTVNVQDVSMYARGVPAHSGINSLRMGTTDRRLKCLTCGLSLEACPGHRGSIELPLPVYQALFIDHTIKVLRSVCYFCSAICITSEEKENALQHPSEKAVFAAAYASGARLG